MTHQKAVMGKKHLQDQLYDNRVEEERKAVDKQLSSTLQLIYTASKVKIYKIADKIASCEVRNDHQQLKPEKKVDVPYQNHWDFELGDIVKVRYPLAQFRMIQIKTIGWNKRLHGVHEHESIVTRLKSKYDNTVQVYTPELFSTSSLYAGVLEKVCKTSDSYISSQWQVGDYVRTRTDSKVVKLLQSRLDNIPDKFIGKKGRVIAVTYVCVIVTFDERSSYDISSYLLLPCEDKTPIKDSFQGNSNDYKVGEKVRVTSNLRKLISNQEGIGWNPNMTDLCGQEVTVTGIREDGNLNLQLKHGRSWRVNPASVLRGEEADADDQEEEASALEDIPFNPQDKVKIKMTANMKMLLASADIPLVFLEYLQSVANVRLIDKDLDCLIRFNCDQKVAVFASTLRKATSDEKKSYEEIQRKVESLANGDMVWLDVGPPNFVRSVLNGIEANRDVIRALTSPLKLIGFTEENRAVVEYEDGRRYRIRKEFLTVPEKFMSTSKERSIDGKAVTEIQDALLRYLLNAGDTSPGASVKLLSMMAGTPPSVEFSVYSDVATCDDLCGELQKELEAEVICPGRQFLISGLQHYTGEVKLGLVFNDEELKVEASEPPAAELARCEEEVKIEDLPQPKLYAQADSAPPEYGQLEAEDIMAENMSWMCLRDRRLAQKVYFPYKVRRVRHFAELDEPRENTTRTMILNSERNVIINL